MYDIIESESFEITPSNGHVFFYKARRRDLSDMGKIIPAAGLNLTGIISDAEDSDTPISAALEVALVDLGAQGQNELYAAPVLGVDLATAIGDPSMEGAEVFEIIKDDDGEVRKVTRLFVRGVRRSDDV
jgi:hypothetical protein